MFLNNRHYDPSTGVFVSVDPLVTSTMQPYIYGAANPVRYSDPSGLEPRPIHEGINRRRSPVFGVEERIGDAIQTAADRVWISEKACAMCDPDADFRPESEGLLDLVPLFHIGPLDVAKLLACSSDRGCQIGVLQASRSDIVGDDLRAINNEVVDDVLIWAGALQADVCGSHGGVDTYCVAVTRLPVLQPGAAAMVLGSFILYDVTDGTDDLQADGRHDFRTGNERLFRHELGHVPQWAEHGSDFLWMYLRNQRPWECAANTATGTTNGAC